MEIPRVGSKPWPTVHRISLTFSWRRTSAAVETEEATYQPREQSWGRGRNPQESKHEKGKKSFPRKNARGTRAAAHSYLPPEGIQAQTSRVSRREGFALVLPPRCSVDWVVRGPRSPVFMAELLRVWEGGRPEEDLLEMARESRRDRGEVAPLQSPVPHGGSRGPPPAGCPALVLGAFGSQSFSALEPGPDDQTQKKYRFL